MLGWVLDTRATNHMTSSLNSLINLTNPNNNTPTSIKLLYGTALEVKAIGHYQITQKHVFKYAYILHYLN